MHFEPLEVRKIIQKRLGVRGVVIILRLGCFPTSGVKNCIYIAHVFNRV
jgi:hypothetical protein